MKLTIDEVAKCLDVPSSTVERWIRQGRIPVSKSGGACFFQKSIFYVWAKKQNLPFALPEEKTEKYSEEKPDNLFNSMASGGVFHDIQGKSVAEVLKSSVENIAFLDKDGQQILLKKLLEREEMASTGIGKGISIPHPRSPIEGTLEEPAIATCFLENPVDFGAIDGVAVFVLFILLSPTVKIHLQLLSKLAYCARDASFVEFLKQCPPKEALLSKVEHMEKTCL